MPKMEQYKKVLVIGSGPIVIGQAAEFDYAGTQACLTLKEEGCEVVLINNNPATIMTDEHIADRVYFEPLTVQHIEQIIQKERPDGILATVSGQTGLNLAFQLEEKGLLEKYGVTVLGTSIEAIKNGEDRDRFRSLMQKMEEPIAESAIVDNMDSARQFAKKVDFPIIVRPAYTLGGSGGGIAENEEQFETYVTRGLRASPIRQCLIEESVAGWKEIEFEVVRDRKNNAVAVCHMENIDPVGVHTGDSIVVAPIQTLAKEEVARLKKASLKIVQHLNIVGACNVQLAYNETTREYIVIEVNPRVSRSSALASKATGYPIAKIATKLSLGYTLDDIHFPAKNETLATYEPTFDYVVVKFPCWPFEKLTTADRTLGTQMKATGETMAVAKKVSAGLQKAVRSLELKTDGLRLHALKTWTHDQLKNLIVRVDDRRFFALLELLRRNVTVECLHEETKIDLFFLQEMEKLVLLEKEIENTSPESVTKESLISYKQNGFTDRYLAKEWQCTVHDVERLRKQWDITASYKTVQAFTEAEEEAVYYYKTWCSDTYEAATVSEKEKVLVIGSGPIQIGQGVEFDYCSVQGILALKHLGYETVLINNNPATVSTDYEIADKLYVEPITAEDVLHIMEHEQITRAIVQFGGQTSINLVKDLEEAGIELLGSNMDTIDTLEDRERFYAYLQSIDVPHIPGKIANSTEQLYEKTVEIGYPILVRPSYVIGGRGMAIIEHRGQLDDYIRSYITDDSYPILIDAYYPGKEVEVDVVTDGNNILIPAIFEHVEKAGVHSGDSMAITPPISLSNEMKEKITAYAEKVAKNIPFKGVFNIQFVIYDGKLYVLEVNPRASRTVPVMSKVTGVNMIELATRVLTGKTTLETLYGNVKRLPDNDFYTVKAPVFSFDKLPGVDPKLVPVMKSTGELISISNSVAGSFTKAFLWNERLQTLFTQTNKEVCVLSDDKNERLDCEQELVKHGFTVKYTHEVDGEIEVWLRKKEAALLYSTQTDDRDRQRALEYQLFVMTSQETVNAFSQMTTERLQVLAAQDLTKANEKEVVLQ